MTATNLLLIGLIVSIVWFGGQILALLPQILDRLPKPSTHELPKSSTHEDRTDDSPHYFARFKIDAVSELSFEVSFADDWATGRPFMLYGPPWDEEDQQLPAEMELKERIGVNIHPTEGWFKRSRIGYIKIYSGGGWEGNVALPYQIARHILDDVRRNPNQIVIIGFSKTTGKDGKVAYPIYGIELAEAFD